MSWRQASENSLALTVEHRRPRRRRGVPFTWAGAAVSRPRRAAPETRSRRARGSLRPDDIVDRGLELAENVTLDHLSLSLLAERLGVCVTNISWHFHRKDDLFAAMASRALRRCQFPASYVDPVRWRESLTDAAHGTRRLFVGNPVLTDLILIRDALSPAVRRQARHRTEQAIVGLVSAGLSPQHAMHTVSALTTHVRAAVVLQRLSHTACGPGGDRRIAEPLVLTDHDTSDLVVQLLRSGRRIGVPAANSFDFGLACILDYAQRLIERADVGD